MSAGDLATVFTNHTDQWVCLFFLPRWNKLHLYHFNRKCCDSLTREKCSSSPGLMLDTYFQLKHRLGSADTDIPHAGRRTQTHDRTKSKALSWKRRIFRLSDAHLSPSHLVSSRTERGEKKRKCCFCSSVTRDSSCLEYKLTSIVCYRRV